MPREVHGSPGGADGRAGGREYAARVPPRDNPSAWASPRWGVLCPVSCALCPMSCALCPVPCVLCPVSCVLCPVPCALCPVPCALCPVPCALCPVPCAQCPVPSAPTRELYIYRHVAGIANAGV